MEEFDLIIIGLGPAGLRAAEKALRAGLSVLAFEKNNTGGTCLNLGCVPTKAIMHSSNLFYDMKNANKAGIGFEGNIKVDYKAVVERKNTIIQKLSKAGENELIKKGLKLIKEKAVADFENLTVNGHKGKNIIVATGSVPFELPNLPFSKKVLSSDDILNLENLPEKIAIIGSGAIGFEWARIFSNFGVEVSIVEKAENLLPAMDTDIQKRAARIFKMRKIKAYTGLGAASFENNILKLEDGKEIEAEIVLSAVGRKRVQFEGLKVNSDLTTNYKNVYAAGDTVSKKMLAHTASMQADYLIDLITGKNPKLIGDEFIPSVIYGEPEIASIGVNEQDINKEEYEIYNLPLSFLAKSWCDDKTDGFIKIIAKDGLIKGAHIISPEASSLIASIAVLMKTEYKIKNINEIVFPHPTYSEGLFEVIFHG